MEPTHKDELNPELNQLEQEKSKLKEEIERITSKIDDIRKDEVKFREEKKAYEEKARLYDLENKKIKYNPKIYQTFQIAIILLLIIIILVYSIFFMHLFSSPTAKIFPPINELTNLISEYWYVSFLSLIPIFLGFTIDIFYRSKYKYRILYIAILFSISLFFDYIIANATRIRIAQANELLGLPTPPLLLDTNFWLVLLVGPLPIIILSILLYHKHKNSKEYIDEQSNNPYNEIITELRKKELNRKYKAQELSDELKQLTDKHNSLLNIKEIINYIPKEELDKRVFAFYSGWIEWITNFYNSAYEDKYGTKQSEMLTKCREIYEKFNQDSQNKFTTIYTTF